VVFLRQPALVLSGLSVVTNRRLSCPFRGFKALRGLARLTLAYAFGLDSAYFFLMWASTARTPLYILETLPSSLSVTPRACETYCTEPCTATAASAYPGAGLKGTPTQLSEGACGSVT